MRKIGTLPTEDEAYRFSDFLYVQEIDNTVELDESGKGAEVWVHDDARLDAAKKHLQYFIANPVASKFDAASVAEKKRAEESKADARRKSRVITRERMEYDRNFIGFAWVPALLAILSIAATLIAGDIDFLPQRVDPIAEAKRWGNFQLLSMTEMRSAEDLKPEEHLAVITAESQDARVRLLTDYSLPEIRSGEVWRLFSSIFVHFGILHIVFNLMWLRDLGTLVQNRFGAWYLLAFALIAAALSNYGQLLVSGPTSGGMSGVNYALFGFVWMRGKHDRFAAWQLPLPIIQTMLVWFFACLVGLVPNIANTAHAVGLVVGMAWGFISAKRTTGAF